MSRPSLAVDADLTLTHGPGVIRVRSEGGLIDIDLPAHLGLWSVRPTRAVLRRWLGHLDRGLSAAGLTARIRVLGLTLVRLGVGGRDTLIGRAFGLAPEAAASALRSCS